MSQSHITTITRVPSKSPLSTARRAECSCGWLGPERGTIVVAADDALMHEGEKPVGPWMRFLWGHWKMAAGLEPGNYVFMEADSGVQRAGEVREHPSREGEVTIPPIGENVWSEPLPDLPRPWGKP